MSARGRGATGVGGGDFAVTIGSDPQCRFRDPRFPAQAAHLRRRGDRLFLRPLNAAVRACVDGQALRPGGWEELTRFDEVSLCGVTIDLSPRLFLGRGRLGVRASPLTYSLPGRGGRLLCDRAWLRADTGTLTAVMGPVGSGKTVFLQLLAGLLAPATGTVTVGDGLDVHGRPAAVRGAIGYVPQDDTTLPELTVRQSLDARLALRFPDMAAHVRERVLRGTARQLGIAADRLETFLGSRIGSVQGPHRGLSGGERKRMNIAHELVGDPLVLFLDEPTSGLSSYDADQLTELLRTLASRDLLTVIATVHQPSQRAFGMLDNLVLLGPGGRPLYVGPAGGAAAYVEAETGVGRDTRPPGERVLEYACNPRAGDRLCLPPAAAADAPPPASRSPAPPPAPRARTPWGWAGAVAAQWATLTRRNARVFVADRFTLCLTALQVPLICLLLAGAFWGFGRQDPDGETFAKRVFHLGTLVRPYEEQQATVPEADVLTEAASRAEADGWHISVARAHRRAAIHFTLVAAAIWVGLLGACREVVTERHVLRRELFGGLSVTAYLGAKLALQSVLVIVQSAVLAFLIGPGLLGLSTANGCRLWAALAFSALAAAALGLWLSGLARTYRGALSAVPLIMVVQLTFGGMLNPATGPDEASRVRRQIGVLTIQRWGFAAALAADPYADGGVLRQAADLQALKDVVDGARAYVYFHITTFDDVPLAALFFPGAGERGGGVRPEAALGALVLLTSALAYGALRRVGRERPG